jgi:hypothetical protein
MKWNEEALECQIFMDVNCTDVSTVESPVISVSNDIVNVTVSDSVNMTVSDSVLNTTETIGWSRAREASESINLLYSFFLKSHM